VSIFDSLDRMTSRFVDRFNETAFVLHAMTRTPNGRAQPDTIRPDVEGFGIFDFVEVVFGIELGVRKSYREANDLRALQTGRDPQLSVDRKYFPTLDQEPKQGDRVTFPSRPELPLFQVVSVQRDGLSRLVIKLVMEGAQV
jgi:hypothetical protein